MSLSVTEQSKRHQRPAARRLRALARLATLLVLFASTGLLAARYLRGEPGEQLRQRALALGQKPETPDFVPTTQVSTGALEVSLTVVGTLKAEESVPVAAETSGTVVWAVDDGVPVKKGDVLVRLQNDQLQLQIDEKKVALVNALSKLEDTKRDGALAAENAKTQLAKGLEELAILRASNKSAIEQAEAALEFQRTELALARAQLGRSIRLQEERLITTRDLDKSREEVAAKEFAVSKAQAQLELQKGQLASNENQKQAEVNRARFAADLARRRIDDEVKNAQKNVDTLKKQLEDLAEDLQQSIVRAPADGVVIPEPRWDGSAGGLRPGDMVSPQRKLMELPNLAKMIVQCEIEEKEIGPVRRGQPVRITLDPYPNQVYKGVVQEVAAVAKPAALEGQRWVQGKNSFSTVIRLLTSDPARLRPGMNATIEIVASTQKNATYVPVDALFERREKPLVYRMRNGRFFSTPVRTGPRNRDYVVITKGVKPGDTISLVFPPENLIAR